MKSHNAVKYIYTANPLYVHLKKHHCPQCNKILVFTESEWSETTRDNDCLSLCWKSRGLD